MNNQYDDIIRLPHHVSSTRPQMSRKDRAAQFAPFAALTGYDAAVREVARQTNTRAELDETQKLDLNDKLLQLVDRTENQLEATFTYFVQDKKKAGGEYITTTGCVKKIDELNKAVILKDGASIPIEDIFDITIDDGTLS